MPIDSSPVGSGCGGDPLPSWRPGPVKERILAFLERVSGPESPERLPPAERIAVLDNVARALLEHCLNRLHAQRVGLTPEPLQATFPPR